MRLLFLVCALAGAPLLSGCDAQDSFACLAVESPAVEVEVVDARTGEYVAADATGFIIDGAYRDTLEIGVTTQGPPDLIARTLQGGFGRAGTYEVSVERAGYLPWSQQNVVIAQTECGPVTQQLRAELLRAGS